jgi:transmembrane sensor
MKPALSDHSDPANVAASWVMRQDRGLSPAEQDEFLQWLGADPSHGEAMARHRRAWENFDRLAGLHASVPAVPDPDLLAPRARARPQRTWRRLAWLAVPLGAAAAILLVVANRAGPVAITSAGASLAAAQLTPIEERTLEDGSTIRLNRGATVQVAFTPDERRVHLERGEADFAVAKDSARAFVVESGGVTIRAVGTAFNVRLTEHAIEVIVTEGIVAVARSDASGAGILSALSAGERAFVPRAASAAPAVGQLSQEELNRRLAWQPRLLGFADESLTTIVNEFNRHNPVVLHVADPALRELRLTVRFRSDNVSGFLRLLAADFGVRSEPDEGGEIVLRGAR